MSDKPDDTQWPAVAGDRDSLRKEIDPPESLEERTIDLLRQQGLLDAAPERSRALAGWRAVRASFAVAACVALLALGVVIGRMSTFAEITPGGTLTGAESNLYALMLYETPGYDSPTAAEALTRYGEYSEWVAMAREREQFVTGEDFDVRQGWLLAPTAAGVEVRPRLTTEQSAPLSGILFVRAAEADAALALARALPHLRHGGEVVVQKTLRTDMPPPTQQDYGPR